jgi:hypothetical protein
MGKADEYITSHIAGGKGRWTGRTEIPFTLSLTTSPNIILQKIFSPRSFLASRLLNDGSGCAILLEVVFGIP